MAGRTDCCRYEATLDELIAEEMMAPVLRSAGLDAQRLRDLIVESLYETFCGHVGRQPTASEAQAGRDCGSPCPASGTR